MNDPAPLTVKEVIARMRADLTPPPPADPAIAALDAEAERSTRHMPQARLARDLARQHLPSAFGGRRYDPAILDQFAEREDLLPDELGIPKLRAWMIAQGMPVPDNFLRAFRDTAIMMGLGRAAAAGGSLFFHARPADAPDGASED